MQKQQQNNKKCWTTEKACGQNVELKHIVDI